MPSATGVHRCWGAGRSSRPSSACWTTRGRARAGCCSSKANLAREIAAAGPGLRGSVRRRFRVVAAAVGELSPAPFAGRAGGAGPPARSWVRVDKVQWADLATTQALRPMPRLLASCPLSWILPLGTSSDAGPAELLRRSGPDHQHVHGRVPSARGVPASPTSGRAVTWPDRAGARAVRGGANPKTGGCEGARVAARLTSC
jgi:hypothetical protein